LVVANDVNGSTKALRLHARNYLSGPESVTWFFEEIRVQAKGTSKLLATIPLGEIVDMDHLLEILRDTPIHQGEVNWNCVSWIRKALDDLSHDSTAITLGALARDWPTLRDSAMEAAAQKAVQYQSSAVH
jgi:hypothetical protein